MLKLEKRDKILKIIKQNREISRTEISRQMNLAKSNVNAVINKMLEDGILMQSDEPVKSADTCGRGRHRAMIKLNENYKFVVGVIAETDYISAGISNIRGQIIESSCFSLTQSDDDLNIVNFISQIINRLLRDNFLSTNDILGIGITLNPSIISQLRYYRFSLHKLEKLFSESLGTRVICTDSVYAMSYYYQEFMRLPDNHDQNRIFIYISDKVYMVPVKNGIPDGSSSDRFDKFIFDIHSSESIGDCIISKMETDPIKCFENILIFVNNLMCIFSTYSAVVYSPQFSTGTADAVYNIMADKFRHLEGKVLISTIEKKKSFLGSCAMIVNKNL